LSPLRFWFTSYPTSFHFIIVSKKGTKTFHRLRRSPSLSKEGKKFRFLCKIFRGAATVRGGAALGGVASRVAFGRRRVSRRFWEAARLASLLGGGASRVAFRRRCVSHRFWETARLASLLGGVASRVAFGRRCVSRRFWEAVRLALLLGGGASRVAFRRRRVSRRFGEAARLASLLKKFLSLGGAASEARRSGWGYSAFQPPPPLRGTPPREGNFRRIATRCVVCCAGGSASPSRC